MRFGIRLGFRFWLCNLLAVQPKAGRPTSLQTGNTSSTSFVGFDVGLKCERVYDALAHPDVSCVLALAICLILREARLSVGIL